MGKGSPAPPLLEQTPSSVVQKMPAKPLEQALAFRKRKNCSKRKVLRTAGTCCLFYHVESSETIFLK